MICWALVDLNKPIIGSNIRMTELPKNLNIPLFYSGTQKRMLKYIKFIPKSRSYKDILLFGKRGRFFDNIFFNFLKFNGARIIYDVSDIPHLQNFYFGSKSISKNLARRFYSLVDIADILLVISPSFLSLLKKFSLKNEIKNKKIIIVPGASNPDRFRNIPIQTKIKNILYVGGYAQARGIEELVVAFNILKEKHPEIRLRLVGPNIPLKFRADRVSVERDKIYRDMPKLYSSAYLCVVPHKRNPYMDSALPLKVYEAMASARPLVVTDCVETKNLVNKEKCGIICHDNSNSLAEAIKYLIVNPKVAEEMGNYGREAIIERHSWKHRAETIKRNLK